MSMRERAGDPVEKRQICVICGSSSCPGGRHPGVEGGELEPFDDTDNEYAPRERVRQFGLGRLR